MSHEAVHGAGRGALTRPKAVARRVLDKALLPYFDALREQLPVQAPALSDDVVTPAAPDPSGAPSDFFHNALHELRTLELERVRKGATRALSVGASGRWYFDWFERHVGSLEEHIGVEAFEPEPPDLPGYATWIDSTADRFEGVADDSVDLVFAGQTTEHLWAGELVGFLLECHRVLRVGGQLVADSPNRLVTEHLRWSHGGHTIELSASEIEELMDLAGFDVVRRRGAWLCRYDDHVHGLEDGLDDPAVVVRRITLGGDRPDDSFIWWIDAERVDRGPEEQKLRDRVDELFAEHWNTRVSRGMWPGPGSPGPLLEPGPGDVVVSSLPIMLHEGRWRVTIQTEDGNLDDLDGLHLVVTSPGGHVVHDVREPVISTDRRRTWEFVQGGLQLALSIEIRAANVSGPVRLAMPVQLDCLDTRWMATPDAAPAPIGP